MMRRRLVVGFLPAMLLVLAFCGPAMASGSELPPLVHDIGIAFLLSGLLAIVFARIRVPAVAGYILGGVLAGPLLLKLVTEPENIRTISELGFVLLLFIIGLEIDVTKIIRSGRAIILSGLLSVPLVAAYGVAIGLGLGALGLSYLIGPGLGVVYIGLAVAMSSTLLVVKLFQETFELDTVPGRLALGLLVMEDLWAIVIILLQPSLTHPEPLAILASFGGIGLLAVVTLIVARTAMPIAFRWIAKVPEVILVGAVAWCFGVVFVGGAFDSITETLFGANWHLSVGSGMGALIAGATIASLPYSTEIITKMNVVKDFFITLFFVSLGMSIPMPGGVDVVVLGVIIAVIAVSARQVVLFPMLYLNGVDQRSAEVTSLRMAQISEFSLVVTFLGVKLGHLSDDLATSIILAFVMTTLLTPVLFKSAYPLHAMLAPLLRRLGFRDPSGEAAQDSEEWKLAFLGFHRVASSLLHDLSRADPERVKETLVVDFAVNLHDRIRETGAEVEYGDLANADTLHHAGISKARLIVSTVPDDLLRGIDNATLVANVRRINPTAVIIANAVRLADVPGIYAAGADYVFLSRIDTAAALNDAISSALNGTLGEYRLARERVQGASAERAEVLP